MIPYSNKTARAKRVEKDTAKEAIIKGKGGRQLKSARPDADANAAKRGTWQEA